jgi:hypothetical protein
MTDLITLDVTLTVPLMTDLITLDVTLTVPMMTDLIKYSKVSKFVNFDVWDFSLLQSPIVTPFFLHFVTGRDHMAGELSCKCAIKLCLSLSEVDCLRTS